MNNIYTVVKAIIVVIALSIGHNSVAQTFSCANSLLSNPEFESDLTDWTNWGNSSSTADAYTGNKALVVTGGSGASGGFVQTVHGNEGVTYNLEAYAKKSSTEYTSISILFYDENWSIIGTTSKSITSSSYTSYSITAVGVPGTAYVAVSGWKDWGTGTATYDAICLTGTDVSAFTCEGSLLNNPQFESNLTNWQTEGNVTVSKVAYFDNDAAKLSGNASCKIVQVVTGIPGIEFNLTGYARIIGSPIPTGNFGVNFLAADSSVISTHSVLIDSIGYKKYAISETAPANTAYVEVFGSKDAANGSIFLDGLCLTSEGFTMLNVSTTNPSACESTDGSINVSVTGGIPPYTFNWSNGLASGSGSNSIINGLTEGSYSIIVNDNASFADTVYTALFDPSDCNSTSCLGEASNYVLLGLDGGNLIINSATNIVGDIGYSDSVISNTNQKAGDDGVFVGTAYVHSGVSSFSYNPTNYLPSGGVIENNVIENAKLEQANIDAIASSTYFSNLATDVNLGVLTDDDNRTVNRVGSRTVVEISSLDYKEDTLTLIGQVGSDDEFIINVLGDFDFSCSEIKLVNVRPEKIVFNFPNNSSILINKDCSKFNGTILAPTSNVEYHNPAAFNGAIIASNINVHSDFNIFHNRLEINCQTPPTLTLNSLVVSNCINQPLKDIATIDVVISWSNQTSDILEINYGNKVEHLYLNNITSPHTLQFNVEADGSAGNAISANFYGNANSVSTTYNAPAACSNDTIKCDILYLTGSDKLNDGQPFDLGFSQYLDEMNGSASVTMAFTKTYGSNLGLYEYNNTGTTLTQGLDDFDLIVVSPTSNSRTSDDLEVALATYAGGILTLNKNIIDDLKMSENNAYYVHRDYAFYNNTESEVIYNYDNINPTYDEVLMYINDVYNPSADAFLWKNSGDMVEGDDAYFYHFESSDVLPGINHHGARTFLGYYMQGLYSNQVNGGTLPAPASSWFNPVVHLTTFGKKHLDDAIVLASQGCSDTTLFIANLKVSECIDDAVQDSAIVKVVISWINAPSDSIKVDFNSEVSYLNTSLLSSPQNLTFSINADGSTGNTVSVNFVGSTNIASQNFDAPSDCAYTEFNCADGIDDDNDGFIDSDDESCASYNPEWAFDCADGTCVEMTGIGNKNQAVTTLAISDSATIQKVIVEATFNGASNAPDFVTFTSSAGESFTVYKSYFVGQSGELGDRYFRAQMAAAHNYTVTCSNSEKDRAESFIAYTFRNCENTSSYGSFAHGHISGGETFSFNYSIPTSPFKRDIEIAVPLSEITNDGRLVYVHASAGNVSKTITIDNYNMGNSLNITPFTLIDVPGSANEVIITVESPPSGQSLYLSGAATATIQCPSNLEVIVSKNTECVIPGETVTYTYQIFNLGNNAVNNLSAVDSKFGAINLGTTSINPSDTITVTYDYTVLASDLPGPISSEFVVSGTDAITAETLNDSITTSLKLLDYNVSHTTNQSSVVVGDTINYTYTINNNGSQGIVVNASNDGLGQVQDTRVTNDLQVLYTFENGSGNMIYDVSSVGEPIDLTISNPANVAWKNHSIDVTAGTRAYNVTNNNKVFTSAKASNELTIETWVKPENNTQTGPARMVGFSYDSGLRNFQLSQRDNDFVGRLSTSNNNINELKGNENSISATPAWYHVVYSYDGTDAKLYVNGVVVNAYGEDNPTGNFNSWGSNHAIILFNEYLSTRNWLGEMGLAAIYSNGLSAAEVLQNFNAGYESSITYVLPGDSITINKQYVTTAADLGSFVNTLSLSISSNQGCNQTVSSSTTVAVCDTNLTVEAGLPGALCPNGEFATLGADANPIFATYQWSTAAGDIPGANASTYNAQPAITTTFYVTATQLSGCEAKDSVTVTVIPCREICNDGIDNDGDGQIDCEDGDCDFVPGCLPPGTHADPSIQAQNYDNWMFGDSIELDFGNGIPTDETGKISVMESSTTFSGPNGAMLFYTDGTHIYSGNGEVMHNGNNIGGGDGVINSSIAFQDPKLDERMFLFVTANANDENPGTPLTTTATYNIININAHGGLGKVDVKAQPISGTSEGLTSIPHANGRDIWVITADKNTSIIYATLVNQQGVQTSVPFNLPLSNATGFPQEINIVANGLHNKLAIGCYYDKMLLLYDFNNVTGVISNKQEINTNEKVYGLEFSPNSMFLYVTSYNDGSLYQLQINDTPYASRFANNGKKAPLTAAQILASRTNLSTGLGSYGHLQIGPDGRIYCPIAGVSLGAILNPNGGGSISGWDASILDIEGARITGALPNYMNGGCFRTSFLLPVELAYFDVTAEENDAILDWQTLSEVNNDYFTIHRSTDAINWEVIGEVAGAGYSDIAIDYNFIDEELSAGVYYYKLEQVDYDGSSDFSEVKAIEIIGGTVEQSKISFGPNPVKMNGYLNIFGNHNEAVHLKVLNISGQIVFENKINNSQISISNLQLEPGIYMFEIDNKMIEKIVVQ